MIELTFVALAVIAGIVIGGPYLLDSINGHFKLWDSAVSDSNNDRLIKADPSDIGLTGSNQCVQLGGKIPGTCNDPKCLTPGPRIRSFHYKYSPEGCQTSPTDCQPDPTCCDYPVEDTCYRSGYTPPGAWATSDQISSDIKAQGFFSCGTGGISCQNGDRLYAYSCGNNPAIYIAKKDLARCMPVCQWANAPQNSTPCPYPPQGDPVAMSTTQDPDVLNPLDVCSSSPGACQVKCANGTLNFHGLCLSATCREIGMFCNNTPPDISLCPTGIILSSSTCSSNSTCPNNGLCTYQCCTHDTSTVSPCNNNGICETGEPTDGSCTDCCPSGTHLANICLHTLCITRENGDDCACDEYGNKCVVDAEDICATYPFAYGCANYDPGGP